ncbi:MAG: arylsulfatase, partial [Verrucomicrobiae bacterium]|nr:arylsulfatase [Verrucomicrobiae bacterium]
MTSRLRHSILFALLALLCGQSPAAGLSKPNIVLILADDLGYGDLSCYGATKVSTPRIDRLAKEGMRFTDAHSASAVCSPTRYGILTGRYPWRHPALAYGVLAHDAPMSIGPDEPTIARLLKSAGYATACVGKWHLGWGNPKPDWNAELHPAPVDAGFDYYFGMPNANTMEPLVFIENRRVVGLDPSDPIRVLGNTKMEGGTAARVTHGEIDSQHVAKARAWLRQHQADAPVRPFFLYLPLVSIHAPQLANARFKGMNQVGIRGEFLAEHDWAVGEILDELDRLGLREDTLVVYSSDNGGLDAGQFKPVGGCFKNYGHSMNGVLRGMKSDAWEGGHRVPMIVRWPGHTPPGAVSDALVSLNDLFVTFASVGGVELPPERPTDSKDITPVLKAPGATARDFAHHASYQGIIALREGD